MKIKVSRKEVEREYSKKYIVKVGYCELYYIFAFDNAFAYNCGVYGWNCDYYYLKNYVICTGYRPHGTQYDNNIIRDLNKKAQTIYNTWNMSYETKKESISKIKDEFIKYLDSVNE